MSMHDNRIGFQYFPDDQHYTQQDLDRWLPRLDQHDARWLVLRASAERAVPESFLRGLIAAGVKPVVHIDCPLGATRPAALNPLLYSYAHWGVEHVIAYDRPNLRTAWAQAQWSSNGLVERFVDASLPLLQAAHSAGLKPILPPLAPGGDYWDTAFLESTLKALARRGHGTLLDDLHLAAYVWTYGRPLDWGAGGPEAWPEARPYSTPEGSQDQRGARILDWYAQISERAIGRSLPQIVVGAAVTDSQGAATPDSDAAATYSLYSNLLQDGQAAPPQAICFRRLAAQAGQPDHEFAWYSASGEPRPSTREFIQAASAPTSEAKQVPSQSKQLSHYLLLPPEEAQAVPTWRRASAFVLTHRPVVGFSADEAAMAEQVTIAGGHELVSVEVEQSLREAGCQVQRLTLLPSRKSACEHKSIQSADMQHKA